MDVGNSAVEEVYNEPQKRSFYGSLFCLVLLVLAIFLIVTLGYKNLLQPPSNFPVTETLVIEPGQSFRSVASNLEEQNYVKSDKLMLLRQYFRSEPLVLKASKYKFETPLTLPEIEERLSKGDFSHDLLVLTHKEGSSVEDLALVASKIIPNFDQNKFIILAKPHEGKLFPDTYHLPQDFSEEELLELLLKAFTDKTLPLQDEILKSSLTLDQIIILASILEREANSEESMKMVSGIIANRLEIGMPIQVDATMEYVLKKPLKDLSPEDLKLDTPYNTYLYQGLPPTPIGNPGLLAISAVLNPTKSDYLFYITGSDGNFYYAKNFEAHKLNIARYLR